MLIEWSIMGGLNYWMHLMCQLMYGMFAAILNLLFSICGMLDYLEHSYTAARSPWIGVYPSCSTSCALSRTCPVQNAPVWPPLLCFASKRVPFTMIWFIFKTSLLGSNQRETLDFLSRESWFFLQKCGTPTKMGFTLQSNHKRRCQKTQDLQE